MGAQPVLRGARVVLRPAARNDVDALWALWTDPEVRRFLWDDRVISRDEAARTVADCLALAPRGLGLWMVLPLPAGGERGDAAEPLGCAGLLPVGAAARGEPRLAGLVEPLVALAPAAWGRGHGRDALSALLAHATGALGLSRLAGVTDVPNVRSDRLLRRAGFVVLGECDGPRYRQRSYLWEAPLTCGRPGSPPPR